jgi:hypothetical protein
MLARLLFSFSATAIDCPLRKSASSSNGIATTGAIALEGSQSRLKNDIARATINIDRYSSGA